jgi:hypothetical protein
MKPSNNPRAMLSLVCLVDTLSHGYEHTDRFNQQLQYFVQKSFSHLAGNMLSLIGGCVTNNNGFWI